LIRFEAQEFKHLELWEMTRNPQSLCNGEEGKTKNEKATTIPCGS
jgi:hypothetical protein